MSVWQNFVFFLGIPVPACFPPLSFARFFLLQDHVPQEPSSVPPVTSAVLEPPAGWSVLPHVLRVFPWQPTKICWKSSWVVIFSFSVSFFSCERDRAVLRSPHSWTQSQQKKHPRLSSAPTNSPRGFRTSWMPTGLGATEKWTQVGSLNLPVFVSYTFYTSLLLFFPIRI